MRTEELIVRLAAEAAPVRPLPSVASRVTAWIGVALPVVAAYLVLAGPRGDLAARAPALDFVLALALLLAVTILSARAALSFGVPDAARPAAVWVLPAAAGGVWAILLVARLASDGPVLAQLLDEPAHAACLVQIAAAAALPGVVLLAMVRRGAAVHGTPAGTFAALAALGAGALGAAIVCPIDNAAHQITWHLAPVGSLAVVGAIAGALWLDRLRG